MYPFQNPELTPAERVKDLLSRLTVEEKIGLLATHNLPIERLGIGEWYVGQEVARGLVKREPENPTTVFPQPIGMAATFDKQMMRQIGLTAGRESRAYFNAEKKGGLMVWGPTVDLTRDPRWGRNEECYGEDPCLTGNMAAEYTLGLRGEEKVWATIPTLKHFCANNHEQERGVDNANLDPRLKHEYYYAAFRTPVKYGGAHSVMTAYNDICHAPADMNHDLRNVLKKDWGLGFVVTDGADFSQNVTAHGTFDSHALALKACLKAGTDTMTDTDGCVHAAARKALADGLISEADLDEAISNLLESRVLLGHFDPDTPYDHLTRADVNTGADRALNLRAAREGMVLLDNHKNALPLQADKHRKIALFGPNADVNLMDWYTGYSPYLVSIRKGLEERGIEVVYDLGWSIVRIQAPNGNYLCIGEDDCLYADADADHAAQFYLCEHDDEGNWTNLRHVDSGRYLTNENNALRLGKDEIYGWFTHETLKRQEYSRLGGDVFSDYLHGEQLTLDGNSRVVTRPKARPDSSVIFHVDYVSVGDERLASLASACDAVVYCGGNDPEQVARECYDRETILLPSAQRHAIWRLSRQLRDIPVVLVLVSSYPYALDTEQGMASAVLWTSHAGPELGHAVAETLFGENNPAGRLPQTWYLCDEDLPSIKDYNIMDNRMTYRWFDGDVLYPFGFGLSYAQFRYDALQTENTPDGIRVTAQITNVSDRDGDEVVQVYAHAESGRIPRPVQQLIAFDRLHIPAGETVIFDQTAPLHELEIWDVSRERLVLESGFYTISLGASSRDLRCNTLVCIEGEMIPPRSLCQEVRAELWDKQSGTEIYTDPMSGETHVRGMCWRNELVYQNCDLTGVSHLTLSAAAPVDEVTVEVYLDQEYVPEVLLRIPPSDGFTDFKEITGSLEADGCHTIRLVFGQSACIESLRAE